MHLHTDFQRIEFFFFHLTQIRMFHIIWFGRKIVLSILLYELRNKGARPDPKNHQGSDQFSWARKKK